MPQVALLAIGTGLSAYGAVSGMMANKQAAQAQQNALNVRSQQERMQQVREARIKAGSVIQAGANQAPGGASAVVGGAQSAISGAETGEQEVTANQSAGMQMIHAKEAEANAQGLVNLGDVFSGAGGTNYDKLASGIQSIFG